MLKESIQQIEVVRASDPEIFKEMFNKAMILLSENDPQCPDENITVQGDTITAIIRYTTTITTRETIKDEYLREGIRHICRECPLHDVEADTRRKWVTCEYSKLGETHLDHECCEYFYKQLKIGQIKPGEPNRSGRLNKAAIRK